MRSGSNTRIASEIYLVAAALVAVAASGCGIAPRSSLASTTTTTGADAYTPGAVELYGARNDAAGTPEGRCRSDLPPNVEFARLSADLVPAESAHLDTWATCLNRPVLEHLTIVLIGGDDPVGTAGLFEQRAERIKDALVRRGVDARRIVIGASNASRAGGPYASTTGVRLELTHSEALRSFPLQDPNVRYGLR